jgi:hypothetical protein
VPYDESVPELDLSFDLMACKICGSRYATEPMLKRIEATLPEKVQKDSTGLALIRICPVCRRNIEAERATRQTVLGRSRKSPGGVEQGLLNPIFLPFIIFQICLHRKIDIQLHTYPLI